jgi:aspartyl-tRNA(Asn)/glutamyl-tRNA(Gln) amidotransferase subunit C
VFPRGGRGTQNGFPSITIAAMPAEFDIDRVARLARIALTDDELELFGRQLGDIIEHAERVQALPTDGVPPTSHALAVTNAFRPDEVTPSLDRNEILAQAPDSVDGFFRVPRILQERGVGDQERDT